MGELEGTQKYTGPLYQFHYQYALIVGMLTSRTLFALVLLAWLIYTEKCVRFVLSAWQQPEYSFLNDLNRLLPNTTFRLLCRLQFLLFLPISIYSLAILGVAVYKGWYGAGLIVIGYMSLLCLQAVARYQYQVHHPGRRPWTLLHSLPGPIRYWRFLLEYLFRQHRLLLAGIKIASCALLYLPVRTLSEDNYDLRMPTVLFGIGILGHSILIYKIRELEEKSLLFYRGLAVPLPARLLQAGLLYAVLLIPEMLTLAWLTPLPLHKGDALLLLLSGYSLLLLLNSLLFIAPFPIRLFLKIVLGIFGLLYFSVLAGWLSGFVLLVLVGGLTLFFGAYYRYNKAVT